MSSSQRSGRRNLRERPLATTEEKLSAASELTLEDRQTVRERLVGGGLRGVERQRDRERALQRDNELARRRLVKLRERLLEAERVDLAIDREVAEDEQLVDQAETFVDDGADIRCML